MKNIYIDCGTHYGQGLHYFMQIYGMNADWDIYTFEANPITYRCFLEKNQQLLKYNNINHFNKAVYTYDGEIVINQENFIDEPNTDQASSTGQASSIISLDKWNPRDGLSREKFESKSVVECIDFSKFIKQFAGHNVIAKFDIEGAEYEVLEKLIEENTFSIFNTLYVEFHSGFFENSNEMKLREQKIKQSFSEKAINLIDWH
jgi:FkbM family methyltransferase